MKTTILKGRGLFTAVIRSIGARHQGAYDLVTDGLFVDLRRALRNPADDPAMRQNCTFCAIAAGEAPAAIVREWPDALAIRPRSGGVNASHLLVLPRVHIEDAGTDPEVTAAVMRRAAELMAEHPAANLITSKGAAATQTVFHLHVHVLGRQEDDGLPLPWTPQHTTRAAAAQAGEKR